MLDDGKTWLTKESLKREWRSLSKRLEASQHECEESRRKAEQVTQAAEQTRIALEKKQQQQHEQEMELQKKVNDLTNREIAFDAKACFARSLSLSLCARVCSLALAF